MLRPLVTAKDALHDAHNLLFAPLTPPPDNRASPNPPHFHGSSDFIPRILRDTTPSHTPHAALAFDAHSAAAAAAGLPVSSPVEHAFRYARDSAPSSASATLSAPSGGDTALYSSTPPSLEHSSGPATIATAISGYPCSPPPSRHHAEHGTNRDKLSGATHFSTQSPAHSPAGIQAATSVPQRLNLTSINTPTLSDQYRATFSTSARSDQSEQPRHLTQTQQQQASSQLRTSSSSVHSPSDRFPPISSMLSSDRYSRVDRYGFQPIGHERRVSDPVEHYPPAKHYTAPASMEPGSYDSPSYGLHRVGRSTSYSDVTVEPSLSQVDWHEEERKRLYMDERSRAAFDPYSPVHSSFSSSNSSIATQGVSPPHGPPYYHSHSSRAYAGTPASSYPLYGSAEDVSYDARPHSSSSDLNSPSYPYATPSSGSRNQPTALTPQHAEYANLAGNDPSSKTYSFVSLPGNTVRKRPRRRYDEIERLYACNFPGCTKAYGTLNHLNAHVNMQKHGVKRHPNEFKEMRKQWRKMKKEQEAERERMVQMESQSSSAGNSSLSDVMHRRRATDPNAYGLHAMNPEERSGLHSGGNVAPSISDPLGMSSLDVSSYGLSSGLSMNVGSEAMSGMSIGGGYGQQQHYTSPTAYHAAQRPPITPVSPSGPTDAAYVRFSSSNGSGGIATTLTDSPTNYYSQSGGYDHDRARTPPPRNQLPPDATLCSAYSHSQ